MCLRERGFARARMCVCLHRRCRLIWKKEHDCMVEGIIQQREQFDNGGESVEFVE